MDTKKQAGTLYVVGTPIGNLEDISLRALRILKEVSLILCEDTRKTKQMLTHFEITNRLESYHQYNEKQKIPGLLKRLEEGEGIALVSNAGMPLISDPGSLLVKAVIAKNMRIVPVPGATALISALAVSGLDSSVFSFFGFLPKKAAEKKRLLEQLTEENRTMIFYESPNRVSATIALLAGIFADREVVIARELTKVFEEIIRGKADELAKRFESSDIMRKGEFVIVVGGKIKEEKQKNVISDDMLRHYIKQEMSEGITKKEAVSIVAKRYNLPKRQVYRTSITL